MVTFITSLLPGGGILTQNAARSEIAEIDLAIHRSPEDRALRSAGPDGAGQDRVPIVCRSLDGDRLAGGSAREFLADKPAVVDADTGLKNAANCEFHGDPAPGLIVEQEVQVVRITRTG